MRPKSATLRGHVEGGRGGKGILDRGFFFFAFKRTISCYDEPEVQDFTETETVDRIRLNLN